MRYDIVNWPLAYDKNARMLSGVPVQPGLEPLILMTKPTLKPWRLWSPDMQCITMWITCRWDKISLVRLNHGQRIGGPGKAKHNFFFCRGLFLISRLLSWILGSNILHFCILHFQAWCFFSSFLALHIRVERPSLGYRFVHLLDFSIL